MIPLQMLLAALLGRIEREQRDVIALLLGENRNAQGAAGPPAAPVERRLAALGSDLDRRHDRAQRDAASLISYDQGVSKRTATRQSNRYAR